MYIKNYVYKEEFDVDKDDMNGYFVDFDLLIFKKLQEKSLDKIACEIEKFKPMLKSIKNLQCVRCKTLDEVALANDIGFEFCIVDVQKNEDSSIKNPIQIDEDGRLNVAKMAEFFLYDIKILVNLDCFDSGMVYEFGADGINISKVKQ